MAGYGSVKRVIIWQVCHGKFQGFESKAELIIEEGVVTQIRVCEVRGRKPLPPSELKEFVRFVEAFKAEIVQKWIDYFVYHRQLRCTKIEGRVK